MPLKRNTKKNKKLQKGKKQKNTTFKKGGYKEESKTLTEIINEKLTDDLVQQLIDNPDIKYYILLNFCDDNRIVVNTNVLLSPIYSVPTEGYEIYNNKLTIPEDFEKGKLMKIIVYANEDGIQYNTIVDKDEKVQSPTCRQDLPILYSVPEITTPSDIMSSADLTSDISEPLSEDEELQGILRDSIPYDEDLTSPNDVIEPAEDMETLQVDDLEDVTEDITKMSIREPTDDRKELEDTIKKEELKGVSEKPELKDFKDDLSLLKKKPKDTSALVSREEGDMDTTDNRIDFRELAKEKKDEKEKAKKEQENIDRLAHEARLKAEEQAKKEEQEEMMFEKDDDELFKNVDDAAAQFQDMANIIEHTISELTKIYNGKSPYRDEKSYQPLLNLIDGKYQTMLEHIPRINIDEKDKKVLLTVLQNNHERLFIRGKHDSKLKVFERNFKEKIKDSIEILTSLRNYFETTDKQYLKDFGKLGTGHRDYTETLGGKKTRKNRRKTKRRKTKKRT
jgi:hypothetical protein|tara:strand:- start:633 stop:2153 length:1521 start_codon:yes stop_codon:yes gene_type:complete